jgi:hypothetical protein
MHRLSARLLAACALCTSIGGLACADVLLDQTNIVGLPTVAAPSQHAFTVTTAEALTVTLTDLQAPAAFSALQIAVTLSDALVGSASVDASHTATIAVPAAAGNYVLYVAGTPDSAQGFGSFGVCVSQTSDTTHACIASYSYSDSLTAPNPPSSTGTLNTLFTSTTAGTYTITLTDDAFPVAFTSLSAGIFQGATPIAVNIQPGASTQLTLGAATSYQLLAAAIPNTTTPAGLYGIRITDPSGAAIFDYSLAVGSLGAATIVPNPAAGPLALTLTDYAYPAPLATLATAVTAGGGPALGTLAAAGTVDITAPAGSIDVWTYAAAGAQPGAYELSLTSGSATLLSATEVVNPGNASSAGSYAFVANIPAAGTYQLLVSDFQFPGALPSPPTATIAQNGAVLTQDTNGNFTAAAGAAIVLVTAQSPQSGSGIFDVTVQTTGASPQTVLDQTQAVAGVFNTQTINLGTTGGYNVTLTDLEFPQKFQDLAVIVSQGNQVLGKIYGGGTFGFAGTPGAKYVVTFVSTPSTQSATASIVPGFGLYALNVASTPPTVTFTSSASSVSAGGTVTLTWSSQNAVSCTASGGTGWTGSQMTSGTLAVVVSAAETLTLSCTGAGGTVAQSVTLAVTPPSGGSHGGGAIDLASILALLTLWVAAYRRNELRLSRSMRAE